MGSLDNFCRSQGLSTRMVSFLEDRVHVLKNRFFPHLFPYLLFHYIFHLTFPKSFLLPTSSPTFFVGAFPDLLFFLLFFHSFSYISYPFLLVSSLLLPGFSSWFSPWISHLFSPSGADHRLWLRCTPGTASDQHRAGRSGCKRCQQPQMSRVFG